ncbi:MAG TPA: HWE histidine kinase domain-containing protein [Phenylobacterium sp.]|uniref:sensor histidine kinase n=1 Tax=Phenylobacterium sp. TaxID=1871053 RepID=UPI002B465562|nr:HWE histidine kinase domain-containing protein [Phenylobacterium sp.]HKR89899.1 HWE histidine kinase domain-containing protein [Phenylobacterium sp.]
MAELIAAHDWASTPLGPLESWSAALRTATSTMLSSSLAMAMLLGDEAVTLYNDAYAKLIGLRHPGALGSNCRKSWPEFAGLTDQALQAAQRGERLTFRDLELTVMRSGVPEQVWANIDCSPVRDEHGDVLGVLSINVETTERVLAERRAVAQVDYLRSLSDQAPGFVCLLGGPPDYAVEYVNEAHKQLFGTGDAEGKPYFKTLGSLADAGRPEVVYEAFATGQRYVGRGDRVVLTTPDGGHEELFVDVVLQPIKDQAGRVTRIYVEGFDVTPLVRAQQAVEETARRLSAAVTVARLGTFELYVAAGAPEAKLDDRAREIFGFGPDEPVTVEDIIGRIDSEDMRQMAAEDADAIAIGHTRREADYRIRLPDGSVRHISAVGDLMVAPDGMVLWSIGVLEDVTERRRAEQRQRLLINELNHRVKNTLATVQSIAFQTLRAAPDLPQARAAFEARLMALSAAHDLLTAQSWRGARLDEVAASALAPFEAVQRPQVARSGPPVWLAAPRALAFSLALHELATNATKYGALAVPEGRVSLDWRLEAGELVFDWTERDGPPVNLPTRSGFGMRLLQRNLARELGGEVAVDFNREGLRCQIRFPVEDRDPAAEAEPVSTSPRPGRFWAPDPDALRTSTPG